MNDPEVTSLWVRNRSDELAVENGCWFDPVAGGYAVWWIERFCKLYEGDHAGEPMILRGLHSDTLDQWPIPDEFDESAAIERAAHYAAGIARGDPADWQYEATMRMYGWQKDSARHGRAIRRFRKASVWVPKKNKKSPTVAAWSLYNLCGDGEQGQKVFLGAKDGSQVREIMGQHVVMMVENSPELSAECKINRNELSVRHLPTNSKLLPMSSGDARTQQSKEGINGSVSIDETHVVDRDFIGRISRAGISRAEPWHIEVSTAGNDPDSYGKEQFDYGQKVASGEVVNEQFFFLAYGVPENVSDEELKKDPVKWGRQANPAWGHTIHEDELLSDFHESASKGIGEWLKFKMYRLNLWQSVATRWLETHVWAACRREYRLEELSGQTCVIGLDLSRTRDMTAAVLGFPAFDDSDKLRLRLWPQFWLTREYARKHAKDAAFQQWADDGHLTLTDGNEIAIGEVYETLEGWSRQFNIQGLFYDPWSATAITQIVEQGLQDSAGKELLAPLGIPRSPVVQSGPEMSQGIDDFEAMVREGRIEHPGNLVLDWQMSHVRIKDRGERTRIEKPERYDWKKIDGAVGSVLTVVGVKYMELVQTTVYERENRGFVEIG